MVQNAPPSLDFANKICFSFPINTEFPNTIAFSVIKSGVLMAYSSGNLIIVLCHCRYVNAILSGHKATIMSIAFEMRGPHIIACDIYGIYYFWHYNDTGYEKSRVVNFGIPSTCISWFPARRIISLSTKKGLLYGSIHDFGKSPLQKLSNKSTFCQLNSDGSLLASHHNSTVIDFYIFSSYHMLVQAVRHLNPVVQFDFHPYLPIFLSITTDLVLHIWRLTNTSNFICTSRIKVNGLCRFIKYPIYFLERMKTDQKPARIAFINQNHKISLIKIDRSGQILNEDKIHPDSTSDSPKTHLLSAFKTNFGVITSVIQENSIFISSKDGHKHQILYHTSNISQISFQKKSGWIFTLDDLGSLIIWPIFDYNYSSSVISHNSSHAAWYNDQTIVFIHFNQLCLYNIYTTDIINYNFPRIADCVEIYVDNNENIFVLTKSEILFKDSQYEIPEFECHSFSQPYENHFILVLSLKSTHDIAVFMFPQFKELKCAVNIQKNRIKSIACISIDSFAVLKDETLEFWNYSNGFFSSNLSIQLPEMKFVQYCSPFLFACDDQNMYSISNGVHPLLSKVKISSITTDQSGNIAYSHGKSFSIIPSPWQISKIKKTEKTDVLENIEIYDNYQVKVQNEDSSRKEKVKNPLFIQQFISKPVISPFDYSTPSKETFNIIHSTLIHLLEYESLFDFIPRQIPAVPNQLAFHLTFPKSKKLSFSSCRYEFNFSGKDLLQVIDEEKMDKFDLFALRYLYVIQESAFPPSYFGLWLSFSLHQSEVSDYLINNIDSNQLSKFYIPLTIHDHLLLVEIVRASIQRAWSQFQKVENVALLLIALGQQSTVSKLYNVIGDTPRGDFFTHDFTTKKYRKSAIKNAYSSLCHGGYEMSAALFIISGEIETGMKVITEKIGDPVLGFLVLRLLTGSDYESKIMKWYLSVARWNDDVIPILISKLTNNNNMFELLEKALLENETNKNISIFGDRRIALFQIYHHIASKQGKGNDILYQVTRNLCCDGLAPLAMYIYKTVETTFTAARPIIAEQIQIAEDKNEIEPEKEKLLSTSEVEIVKEVSAFDFGGVNDFGDDIDWSDSESDSDLSSEEKSESLEKSEVKSEVDDSIIQNQVNESKNAVEDDEIDCYIKKSIRDKSFCLSRMFIDYNNNDQSSNEGNDINDDINNEAAHFAMNMGDIDLAAKLFDENKIIHLEQHLAQIILFSSIRFLYSSSIPSDPSDFYHICKLLLKLSTKNKNSFFDFSLMKKDDHDGFSIFSFLGAFVISLWAYHHNLMYSLLCSNDYNENKILSKKDLYSKVANKIENSSNSAKNSINEKIVNNYSDLDNVPPPRSLFDIDLSSSRFPDTIPKLLQHYLSENLHGLEQSLERDRLLIMYLIFALMLNKLNELYNSIIKTITASTKDYIKDAYSKLYSILNLRKESILKIIEFYQLSLKCPSLLPPSLPNIDGEPTPVQSFISAIIIEHMSSKKSLELLQQRIIKKLPISFIINMKLNIDENKMNKTIFKIRDQMIKGIVITPLNLNKLVAISSNSIFSVDLESSFVSPEKNLIKNNNNDDPLQIIIHSHLNLILVISPYHASLYDFNSEYGNQVSITFNQHQGSKFTCAQFSPNGEKVAICSSFVEIYFFDFTTECQMPFMTINIYGQVNSILWLNQDTFLIVAYISNKDKLQKLALINLLSSCIMPLPIDPNLNGKINVMEIERRNGFIILGTKNGMAAIIELITSNDFKLKWLYDFKKTEVSAAAALNNLFAFGTLDGDVLLVDLENENMANNFNTKLFKVQFAVSSIIIEIDRIIIAGDANYFEVWKAGEYF
ncbi:hypothetical protein M9Y10_002794 [Tritrichomonas musculus]|uniref:RAVE complex protein Rav1 C-terminal domain-containing protein n=1 Tax=Tritrichomonas musculus TaxID=1915356 RepID=A0ABR2LC64_9EUKA